VDMAVLQPGADLPRHRTGQCQVFTVVAGRGPLSGEDGVEHGIHSGQSAVWERGEFRSSRAVERRTVVITQSRAVD